MQRVLGAFAVALAGGCARNAATGKLEVVAIDESESLSSEEHGRAHRGAKCAPLSCPV